MTRSSHDQVVRLFRAARRRIHANTALRVTAISLWPLAGIGWLMWLTHRFAHPVSAYQVAGIVATWTLLTCIAVVARLPGAHQTLLRADRALNANSLLVCALDDAPPGRRVSGSAASRVARDAAALASSRVGVLGKTLPLTWPGHGTVALLALSAAAILSALPGARAPARVVAAAPPPAPAPARDESASTFTDIARELTAALATDRRRDTPSAQDTTLRAAGRFSASTETARADQATTGEPDDARPTKTPSHAGRVDASGPGGDAPSNATAGRLADGGRADDTPTLASHAIPRRGSSPTPSAYRFLALDDKGDATARPDAASLPGAAPWPDRPRYASPAMRHYLARFEQLRQETDQ